MADYHNPEPVIDWMMLWLGIVVSLLVWIWNLS